MNLRDDNAIRNVVEALLAAQVGAAAVTITDAERLAGGAVQENWRLDVDILGGDKAGRHRWVLRTDAAVRLAVSLDRTSEFHVLQAAYTAGVRVAAPIAKLEAGTTAADKSAPIPPCLVQSWLGGSAQGRRIVRDPALAQYGDAVCRDLAHELAKIHALTPPVAAIACLPLPAIAPARVEVARLRKALDGASEPRPALEYCLAWLDQHAPPAGRTSLVHGDFRTGNYLVDNGRLTGILDWEFAHWGDPDEDLGWFSARCWRFGNDALEAGGIAPLSTFLAAYREASGRQATPDAIAYWQIMAAAKWATIAVLQGDRFRRGGEASLELALTGLMPPQMEHDALTAILSWKTKPAGGPTWR